MSRPDDPPLLTDLMRFKPDGWTANGWAVAAGVSRTVWTDMRRHANPSRRTLEKLLAAAGSSLAEFEALRVGAAPPPTAGDARARLGDRTNAWRGAALPPIPVYAAKPARAVGGLACCTFDPSTPVASVERPSSLTDAPSAFALPVIDDAMAPRFRQGHTVIVVPGRDVPTGSDVLVMIDDGQGALAELVARRDDLVVVRQHGGREPVTLSAKLHLVVGEAL